MNFADVDRRYAELWQMYQSGALTAEQFDQQLHAMMIQDSLGRWWAKSRESGDWHYFDPTSNAWVKAQPPVAAPPSQPGALPAPAAQAAPAAAEAAAWAPARTAAPAPQSAFAAPEAGAPPELGSGMKVIFYILSFVFGLVGIILFFVYRNKPAAADRSAARLFLLLGVLSLLLSCLCTVTYVVLFSSAILQGMSF